MEFTASTHTGSGRGKGLGAPTINLTMDEVPESLKEGIYACRATFPDGKVLPATIHYGPRPVFKDIPSCEIHVLDELIENPPDKLTVEIVQYLRGVEDFESPEALAAQIQIDIEQARSILRSND